MSLKLPIPTPSARKKTPPKRPTTGLDAASAQRLLAVIRRFAAGHTVIVITHDPRIAAAADDVPRLPRHAPRVA